MGYTINKKRNLLMLFFMVLLSLITQILAIMKSAIVAGLFGTTSFIDAYNYANSISTFIFAFISAGISTVIIPFYAKDFKSKEIYPFITLIYSIIVIVVFLLISFSTPILTLLTNREALFIRIASQSLLVILLSNVFGSISNITIAFFQCIDKYNLPKIVNLLSQSIVVFYLLWVDSITIFQYSLVIASGVIINFIVDTLLAVKNGWRLHLDFSFNSSSTRNLIKLFIPIVISTGVYSLSLLIDSTIASRLDEGKITILSYSSQIAANINSIIIGNLLLYLYPKIVKRLNNGEGQDYFWKESFFFHGIVCLIIAGYYSIGQDGISLLFEHGKFDAAATESVFWASFIYVVGQQTNIIRDLVYRFFYAKGNTKTPASNSILISLINIVLSVLLVFVIGFYGIICGTVVSSLFSLVVILYKFKNAYGFEIPFIKIVSPYLKNIIITIITMGTTYCLKQYIIIDNPIVRILLFGLETMAVFIMLTWFINRIVFQAAKEL